MTPDLLTEYIRRELHRSDVVVTIEQTEALDVLIVHLDSYTWEYPMENAATDVDYWFALGVIASRIFKHLEDAYFDQFPEEEDDDLGDDVETMH